MKKLYKYKFKMYKRFQSDIWGLIILKNKSNNNLFKFILAKFNYTLKKFWKKRTGKFFLKKFKPYLKKKPISNFFINKNSVKSLLINTKKIIPKRFLNVIKYNETKILFIKKIYHLFWLEFYKMYYHLSIYPRYARPQVFKYKPKKNIQSFFIYLKRKRRNRNFFFWNRFSKFKFRKKHRLDIFSHLENSYMSHRYGKRKWFYFKKPKKWWRIKIEQEKIAIFFGFFNSKRFLRFQQEQFFMNKLRLYSFLKLVGKLTFLIFNFNFYNNMYYIFNFIKRGNVKVNNKIITNPDHIVQLFDNISFDRAIFKKLLILYKLRLKSKTIFFNCPKYLEINYKILTASIWRYPLPSEIIGPYTYPFKSIKYDWLIYKNISK